jgi:phosphorylase kinase alpha/beta subunit
MQGRRAERDGSGTAQIAAHDWRHGFVLLTLMAFVAANPQVQFDDDLALDVVIGHAVRAGWQLQNPEVPTGAYPSHKADAWDLFYRSSPAECRRWQLLALQQLAEATG